MLLPQNAQINVAWLSYLTNESKNEILSAHRPVTKLLWEEGTWKRADASWRWLMSPSVSRGRPRWRYAATDPWADIMFRTGAYSFCASAQRTKWCSETVVSGPDNKPFFLILAFCSSEINMGFAADVPPCPTSQPSDPFLSTKIQTDKKEGGMARETKNISISWNIFSYTNGWPRIRWKTRAFKCKFQGITGKVQAA